jgi:peptidoglycan hydrolase FlgJ
VGTTLNSLGSLSANAANNLALDSRSLDRLHLQAKQEPDKALKLAAKQFETVFMNMMLKSMRDATPQDGMFDSEQTKMFTSMLDQQLAQNMSNRGVGLAEMMVKQLSRQMPAAAPAVTSSALAFPPVPGATVELPAAIKPAVQQNAATPAASGPAKSSLPSAYSESVQQDFVRRMLPHAAIASRETGLPAHQMIGQAALESGWGRRTIRMADGSDSHNLFGIKAGANWQGSVAEAKTTEYHNGVASKPTEKFRAYASYADAFRDYARLLGGNERYAGVLKQGDNAHGFAQALQDSGYATDPRYAEKLVKVIGKVHTLA